LPETVPRRADVAGVFAQGRLHVEAQAIDVDMQLILRAGVGGIDRQADRLGRHGAVGALIDEMPCLPGGIPVVGRSRREDLGTFDAGDVCRRHQQELRIADAVLQDHVARGEIDLIARLRRMELLLVGHALLVDDVPQRIGIRRSVVRSGEHSA
jgi:hypothetical protein